MPKQPRPHKPPRARKKAQRPKARKKARKPKPVLIIPYNEAPKKPIKRKKER